MWEGVLKAQPNRWVAAEEQVIAIVFIEKHFQKTRIMPGVPAPQGMDRQGEGRSIPASECAFVGCFEAPASRVQVAVERPLVPPQHGEVHIFVGSRGPGEEQVDSPADAEAPAAWKVGHEVVDGPNGGEDLHDEVVLAAFRHRGDGHTMATSSTRRKSFEGLQAVKRKT